MEQHARVEFHPRALVATAAAIVAVAGWIWWEPIYAAVTELLGVNEEPRRRDLPRTLGPGDIESARVGLGADVAFDLSDAASQVRAFVFDEGATDYTVVFYRERGGRFEQLGGPTTVTDFDPPTVHGTPPRVHVRGRQQPQVSFVFRVEENDVLFEPDDEPGHTTRRVIPGPGSAR